MGSEGVVKYGLFIPFPIDNHIISLTNFRNGYEIDSRICQTIEVYMYALFLASKFTLASLL